MSTRQGDELRRRLARELAQVRAEVAIEIAGALDREMPVDTGWALANTLPSVGAPVTDPVGSRESVNPGTAAQGLAEVMAMPATRPEADVFVSNPVPYVEHIDARHPTAAGLVQRAVDAGLATARERVAVRKVEL